MSDILETAEVYATQLVNHKFSERLVYHDIHQLYSVVSAVQEIGRAENLSDEDMEITSLAAWLANLGLIHFEGEEKMGRMQFFSLIKTYSLEVAEKFLQENDYPANKSTLVLDAITGAFPGTEYDTLPKRILADAITSDFGKTGAKSKVKKLYDEFILTGAIEVDRKDWFERMINYLREHDYLTDYGKEVYGPKKLELIAKLGKEKKGIQKKQDQIISKELNISDGELKKLKKSLSSVKGRDDRGIQTMFRTVSKNHYTLTEMVDRKANIMISINSILLSLIIGRLLAMDERFCIHNAPLLLMLFAALVSIFFAVYAIRPVRTHGSFTEDEIRNKQGNLLFYGNYHDMKFRDYHWGMLQMMNDSEHMYTSMIRDLYFLGKKLDKKTRLIRRSLNYFIIGFVVSVIAFFILTPLVGSHF